MEPVDDEFVATFYDANINASGDTREDAVENLKDVLVNTFRRYSELGENQLGVALGKICRSEIDCDSKVIGLPWRD